MNIPALSTMQSMGNVQNQAGLLIMKKAMDSSQQNGQAITDMLASGAPKFSPAHLGQVIDISA